MRVQGIGHNLATEQHSNNCPDKKSQSLQNSYITEFSKVIDYMYNIQKTIQFLYTNNEYTVTEIKNAIPMRIAPKKIKYLGVYLSKHAQDLYP